MEHTHWRKILESPYLAGAELDDGNGKFQPIVLTIKSAGDEMVREIGTNKEEKCLVIHWQENRKPMICNVTNAKAIEKATGTAYVQEWAGHKIKIGTEKVKAFGEIWDALRVKPYKVEQAPQELSAAQPEAIICTDCKKPISDYNGAPARNIAVNTHAKYGRALCFDCAQIAKAALEAAPAEPEEGGDQLGIDEAKLPFDPGQ